jgi:hypothetical protein
MFVDKEVESRREQILTGDKTMPNKPRTIRTQHNKKGGVSKKGAQAGKKKNT